MFSDLFKIIIFVKDSIIDLTKLKSEKERKSALLDMLKTYFLLLDSYKDAMNLLEKVDQDPIKYISSLDDESAKIHIEIWDKILRKQGLRLYMVEQYINSQSYLAIINPDAVKAISEIIGYKMDRLVNLYRLGSQLHLRNCFPLPETPEGIANLVVTLLTKQESGLIDKQAVFLELNNLKDGLDKFRAMIEQSMSKEEMLELSNKAREETKIT